LRNFKPGQKGGNEHQGDAINQEIAADFLHHRFSSLFLF
jgi:hypothetical protein